MAILFTCLAQAQQDAQYTQYMYNAMVINPAFAGSTGLLNVTGLHRSQWVGLDGGPQTQTLSVSTPISPWMGIGLSLINDAIGNGTNQDTYIDGSFSYAFPISPNSDISLGLKVGGHVLNIDYNKLRAYRPELNFGANAIERQFNPNFGVGAYYYLQETFYAGLSAPNLLNTRHFQGSGQSSAALATERTNWYLVAGYFFNLKSKLQFKPAFLLKAVSGAPLQLDISSNFMLNHKFAFGMAYRWSSSISALVGFQMSQNILLGLAYDHETTTLGNTVFDRGSFEVVLRYQASRNKGGRNVFQFF